MRTPWLVVVAVALLSWSGCSKPAEIRDKKPRLVVGIIVDQMRADYIQRYWEHFGEGGFRRLVNHGFRYENAHYNYMPTYTGPGHASIATGTTPMVHGIISNDWYDWQSGTSVYCVEDTNVTPVGTEASTGEMSPHRLMTSTFGDALRMSTRFEANGSKVFGVAIKDRSAIFSAGSSANGAYWYDPSTGDFVTSSHYADELPAWLNEFNAADHAEAYLEQTWDLLHERERYTASIGDTNDYERGPRGTELPVFPYNLKELVTQNGLGLIGYSPFGNDLTLDLAREIIAQEELGQDYAPDYLAIGFSATDKLGHIYAPQALEMEDVYVRLDKKLSELFHYLDEEIGRHRYTVFLTADHGAVNNPNWLMDNRSVGGYFDKDSLTQLLNQAVEERYGDASLISNHSNLQLFFDHDRLKELGVAASELTELIRPIIRTYPGVAYVVDADQIQTGNFVNPNLQRLQRGYHPRRSGDMAYVMMAGWLRYASYGTSHGTPFNYDTHVPMLFYGSRVEVGKSTRYTTITQIAPTMCSLLEIPFPNGSTGQPLVELTDVDYLKRD